MSKKISLNIEGKVKPNLSKLFKKFIVRKDKEVSAKMAKYYKLFPFLAQWSVDPGDAEEILHYYGYLDKNGNLVMNPEKSHRRATLYDILDFDEDDMDFDDYEEIYPGPSEDDDENIYSELYPNDYWDALEQEGMNKKKGKGGKYKHSKGKKGKNKGSEDYDDITKPYSQGFIDEETGDEEDNTLSKQYIFFYPDYHDKTDRLEFNSLKEFDKFCSHNDFLVPPYVGERIAYRPVSHVCLNPGAKERGVDEIMGAENYHDMFFEAGEELQVSYR